MPAKKQKPTPAVIAPSRAARISDVTRPDAMPPADATARPVIISNRAIMHDPMMAPQPTGDPAMDLPAGSSGLRPAAPKPSQKMSLRPLPDHSAPKYGDADGVLEPEPIRPLQTPGRAAQPAQTTRSDESIEALDGDTAAAKLEADAKAQDEIETLIDEKTYFLPINAVVQRRSRHVFIIGIIVIVLLAALWLNVAMDAGFVTIPGLKPVTHLFST